ncbi:MAG: T9SS type B sorting domain-containing protein [Flavobacteriales bacterium]
MRNILSLFFIVNFLFCWSISAQQINNDADQKNSNKSNNYFIKNEGQIIDQFGSPNNKVLYLLNTTGLNVQLHKNGFSYDVYENKIKETCIENEISKTSKINFKDLKSARDSSSIETLYHRIDVEFLEANNDLLIEEHDMSKSYANYYNIVGHEDGITNVHSFKKIVYKNLYKGIDLEFFVPINKKKPVEYNFIIRPEGDISSIKMKISGTNADVENNSLKMNLIHGLMSETIPKSWIRLNKRDKEVAINYVKKGNNVFGFEATDRAAIKFKTLIIDPTPVREWATYFGGSYVDGSVYGSMDFDSNGDTVYATMTVSDNIATTGSHQPFNFIFTSPLSHQTGLMMKFDPCGDLLWSTYYGGKGATEFYDVKIDSQNNIIGVGYTFSDTHIATSNSHQEFKGGAENDGFLVKFNSNGERIWSSYYGGIGQDVVASVSTDNLNNIFIAGSTGSDTNIVTPNAFDLQYEDSMSVYAREAFIAKFDQNGNRVWGTYYGGSGNDAITNIEVGNDSNIYLVGYTDSTDDIATVGAYKEILTVNGPQTTDRIDTFVAKFNTNGNRIWGTYFGGDAIDWGYDLAIDNENNIIISGATQSTVDIAFNNSHQVGKGGDIADWDDFIAKFNSNGALLWSSYYGGAERENYVNCSVDTDMYNNIYLAGGTSSSSNISTANSYQENYVGYANAYLVKFDALGKRIWGTYYGENQAVATDVRVKDNSIYLFGKTSSDTGISSPGAYQTELNYDDCFIVKFKEGVNFIEDSVYKYLCAGEDIEFTATGGVSYLWSGPNGFTSAVQNPIITNASITDSGTYTVFIESANGCDDTREFEVLVSEKPVAYTVTDIVVCEDVYATGISSTFNTSNIESQVLGGQTNMVVSYFDENGVELPNQMANINLNTQLIIVRVANENNPVCYAETSFNLIVIPLPYIVEIDDLQVCDVNSDGYAFFNLEDIKSSILGNNANITVAFYFENGQLITNPLDAVENQLANEEIITVRATNTDTDCYNEATFKFIVNPLPIANILTELIGCDDNNNGISEYFDTSNIESQVLGNQTGLQVSYFDVNGNPLPSTLPNPYTNTIPNEELITVRVTNPITTCFSETSVTLKTASQPQINQPQTIYACDLGNGYANFDLAQIETEITGNQSGLKITYFDAGNNPLLSPLPSTFQNTQAWSQTIYVRVENELNSLCYSETSFNLIVNQLPLVSINNSYFLCNLEPSLSVSVESNFDTYNWEYQDGTIISSTYLADLINAGNYTLTVGQNNNGIYCENSFDFKLIRSELPSIVNVGYKELSDENFIKINASGDGDLEYSIDGINYQSSNLFNNVAGGIYMVSVKDKLGCGEDFEEVIIIDYPKYFTPNGDGVNDTWQIKGIRDYPNAEIFIHDRYGKLLKQIFAKDEGWNGTFRGEKLTATDYWFTVKLTDSKTFTGHFALKR